MSKIIQKAKEVFLKMDLFANPQLLKYRGEGAYQTYTGSCFSVTIVVLFVATFYSMIKSTINREKITVISKTKPSLDSAFVTDASNSQFMFGIGLEDFDLTANSKLFDISMSTLTYKNSKLVSEQKIGLTPCTIDQWSNINSQFQNIYTRLSMGHWLCPPKGHGFTFKGKLTSQEFIYTKISLKKCTNSSSCASEAIYNSTVSNRTFKLSAYFANPVIDPSQKKYLDYVLEDTSYFQFTDQVGVNSHMFFTEYQVNTDNTIWPEPITDIKTQKGLTLIQRPVVSNPQILGTDELVKIHLKKADIIHQYDRTYTRLDVTFAYLGGLFGMIMIFFYGLRVMSEYAYEYQIGSDILKYKEDQQFQSQKFHLLRFPIYLFYCIVTFVSEGTKKRPWFEFYQQVDKCREQAKKQSDLGFLLKRVIFIEKTLEIFFNQKLKKINLHHKLTIAQAEFTRINYDQHNSVKLDLDDQILNPQVSASSSSPQLEIQAEEQLQPEQQEQIEQLEQPEEQPEQELVGGRLGAREKEGFNHQQLLKDFSGEIHNQSQISSNLSSEQMMTQQNSLESILARSPQSHHEMSNVWHTH